MAEKVRSYETLAIDDNWIDYAGSSVVGTACRSRRSMSVRSITISGDVDTHITWPGN